MSGSDKSAGKPGDELNALIHARSWLLRRVDRLEFVDLTSVRRTIVFTLDLAQLRKELPKYHAPPASGVTAFPLEATRGGGAGQLWPGFATERDAHADGDSR
jgi:hypothetical protein